jgi:hypothetical protein
MAETKVLLTKRLNNCLLGCLNAKLQHTIKKPAYFRNFSGVELDEFNTLNLKIKKKNTLPTKKKDSPEQTEKEQPSQASPPNFL